MTAPLTPPLSHLSAIHAQTKAVCVPLASCPLFLRMGSVTYTILCRHMALVSEYCGIKTVDMTYSQPGISHRLVLKTKFVVSVSALAFYVRLA